MNQHRHPRLALVACMLAGAPLLLAQAPASQGHRFEFGFEERIRSEDWNNIMDFNERTADYHTQYRFRSRAWLQYNFGDKLEVVAGLANENRRVSSDATKRWYNGREVFFETLYLDYKFSPAFSVRVGRQNIQKGEGFLIFDGTPGDGSRTGYYNAADLTWSFSKSKLELLYISDPWKDKYLPVVNEITNPKEMNRLVEWDEKAYGIYYTGKEWTGNQLELYGFHKTETNDYRLPQASAQPERRFNTIGARVVQEMGNGFTGSAEYALQRGTEDAPVTATAGTRSRDIEAWGGYARVKKAFDASWKPSVSVGYIGMSGQDPARPDKMTAWNPLFSRWPKWSELYIYSQARERGVAYWTNLGMWEVEFRCAATKALDLRATYYKMAAMHPNVASATPVFSTGKDRGNLWQVRADYRFNASFKGHALYEHMAPGDYYAGKDGGHFVRFEVSYLFKKKF